MVRTLFVTARPEWGPPWPLVELGSPKEVEALEGPPGGSDLVVAWAWIDEGGGTLRARAFGRRIGIAEDEAHRLGRHEARPRRRAGQS